MLLPRLSIRRPVLAAVLSLALIMFGITGYSRLPIRELPDVDFPIVSVLTVLRGASPEVVESEITELLEEELNGIEGIDTIKSTSTEQVSRITIQFDLDRDIDAAAQDVRDRVNRVRNRFPQDTEEPQVRKVDADAEAIMWLAVFSESRPALELIDLSDKVIKSRLETIPGVGEIIVGGSNKRAMRIELDRNLMTAHSVAVADVLQALRDENVELPSGRVEGAWREFVVRTQGDLTTPEQFAEMVVSFRNDQPVRLRDIGTVRHGYENERTRANFNGLVTTGLGVVKQPRANTLSVARAVKAEVERIRTELPEGYQIAVAFDQSSFIEKSVAEVQESMLLATLLVVVIIFVFLQSVRTTLIPSIVIPVSIVSTFGVMYFLDFTINNLTLLALTLVVGVVVDDAIIVLENVYRHMEEGKERMEAALIASDEIGFAVVATTLTLLAVFVPIAFLSGITGRLFYEFGISVAVAVGVSGFVALTLTPMLCSRMLRLGTTAEKNHAFGRMARAFDRGVAGLAQTYAVWLGWTLRHRLLMVAVLVATTAASVALFFTVGKEFVPDDDRGYFLASLKSPEGSTLAYQLKVQGEVEQLLKATPELLSYFSVVAPSSGGPGSVNSGIMFARLKDAGQRTRSTQQVIASLRAQSTAILGTDVFFFVSNPLRQSSHSKPLQFAVQSPDFVLLAEYSQRLAKAVETLPGFRDVDLDLEINKPQLNVEIDRDKAASLGISAIDVADTLRVLLGGHEATRFRRGNELYEVIVQLAATDRFSPTDPSSIYVRTASKTLVPLANVMHLNETVGPSALNHYDRKRSILLDAGLEGVDLGSAITKVAELARQTLPAGFTTSLAGESREFQKGSQGLTVTFLLALAAVYLVLAGQFESFIHPFTIMLALPLAAFGALAGLAVFGMTLNVYSFIGLIMLMGLVTKNSILLVDYANLLRERGEPALRAITEAGRVRLRPILMTAASTIVGIIPVALGLGAGSESRRPLGVAVLVGMTTSTLLTLFVVPVFYTLVESASERVRKRREKRRTTAANLV
ncbi:MAG: efflux RND transporter permease subunit [Deltaproteobacteria bacterium]|nr:efflux RND transporter permease subunit [Deltaproteobacteria bacterium]